MNSSRQHMKSSRKVLLTGIVAGASFWFVDSIVDGIIFGERSFADQFLHPEPVEVWVRLFVLVMFTVFSLYVTAITRRLARTESALVESEEKARAVTDTATDAVIMMDAGRRVTYWNLAAERMFGHSSREALGEDLHRLLVPARFMERFDKAYARFRDTGDSPHEGKTFELSALRKDGTEFPVEISLSSFKACGRRNFVGFVRDITSRKRAEEEVAASKAYLNGIMDGMSEPVMVIGADYNVTMMNRAARETYMAGPDSWRPGSPPPCYRLVHNLERPCDNGGPELCPMRETIRLRHPALVTHEHTTSGRQCIYEILASPLCAADGTIYAAVVSSRDVTARVLAEQRLKEHEAQLDHMAHHDPLTGLPNRLLFADRLDVALAHAHRHREEVAVMFIDLDRFKAINDTFGHSAGDRLLQEVSGKVSGCLRDCDTVSRLGGDEFGMVIPDIAGGEDAVSIAKRVLDSLRGTFELEGRTVLSTASIGMAVYPGNGNDAETLLKHADSALYQAKEQGRDRLVQYLNGNPLKNSSSIDNAPHSVGL